MGDVTVVTSLLAFVYSKSKEGDLHNICYFFYIFCAALVQEYLSHLPLKLKKISQENKNFYWKLAHKNISQPLRAWTTLAKRVFFSLAQMAHAAPTNHTATVVQ